MATDSIRLSPKHGVNPGLELCFLCGEPIGVVLYGKLKGDKEAPREAIVSGDPCEKCKGYMTQGIILISVRDGEQPSNNPYRTGGWVVVREEMIERLLLKDDKLRDEILKQRMSFIEDAVWVALGLPYGEEVDGG